MEERPGYCIHSLLQLNKSSFFKCLYQKGETILLLAPQKRGRPASWLVLSLVEHISFAFGFPADADMQRIKNFGRRVSMLTYVVAMCSKIGDRKSIFACRIG